MASEHIHTLYYDILQIKVHFLVSQHEKVTKVNS